MPETVTTQGGEQPRNRLGKWAKSPESIERDQQALKLAIAGASYSDIAKRLGYGSASNVRRALSGHAREVLRDDVYALQLVLGQRYELLWREGLKILGARHQLAQNGRMVVDQDGNPVEDPGPKIAALNTLVKITSEYARMAGAVAPSRVDLQVHDELDEKIKQLMEEMGNPVLPDPELVEGP